MEFTNLKSLLNEYIIDNKVGNIAVRVGAGDAVLSDTFLSSEGAIGSRTLFDMASCTKIMATAPLALIAADRGLLSLGDPVGKFFECPDDKRGWTVKTLLTHTTGFGHKAMNKPGNTYDNIAGYILGISSDIPPHTDVRYSCPAYILLGKILEEVFGMPLDKAFYEYVAGPLGLDDTKFSPVTGNVVNSNTDEALRGTVNDYNCRFLGGICGNAGLFSDIEDVTKYVAYMRHKGRPLISEKLFAEAISNHTPGMSAGRGLGFLYVDERYTQTGGLFRTGSVGHCGHTGQSVFVDTESGFYVIILSDATVSDMKKYGPEHSYGRVMKMREEIHRAIGQDLAHMN